MSALGLSPAWQIFGGIWANLREWWFFVRTRPPAAAPTYFTCGLVNVQRMAAPLPDMGGWENRDRWLSGHLCRASGVEYLSDLGDLHGFTSDNFGVLDGRIRCVDYPSPDVQRFLLKSGDALLKVDLPSSP
jgi:hypothetical protein